MKPGLHIYVPAIHARYGGVRGLVRQAKAHGVVGLIPFGPWHDGSPSWWLERRDCRALTDACAAEGLDATLCGYPDRRSIEEYLDDMVAATTPGTTAWLHDPERHMKGPAGHGRGLVMRSRAEFDGETGWTSFGAIRSHPTVRPAEYGTLDFGSPQLYDDRHVADRFEQWIDTLPPGSRIIPSAGAYRHESDKAARTGPQLLSHLGRFITVPHRVETILLWSLPFVTRQQWEAIGTFAGWMRRGACGLPP